MNIKRIIKSLLRDANESSYTQYGSKWLSHHDICHLQISKTNSVLICGAWVTGISGVCIPEFGTQDDIPEYDGLLDECRVALYQLFKYPSVCGVVRGIYWCLWLTMKGENPIRVLTDQYESMK